jgi:hypothetical protein
MTTITEAQQDISTSEPTSSTSGLGPANPPKPGLGGVWLAIVALVAVVAVAAALALDVFDSSADTATVTIADPRSDADFHRPSAPAVAGLGSDEYREMNQHVSKTVSNGSQFSAGAAMNQYLADEAAAQDSDTSRAINQQESKAAPSLDPRLDADHHREAPKG